MGDETVLTTATETPAAEAPPADQAAAAAAPEGGKPADQKAPTEEAKGPKVDGDDKGESSDTKEGDEEGEKGAPEEYADFTLPEGMEIDAATLDAFKPLAQEFGLDQEQAQRLVDLYAGKQAAAAEAQQQAWADMQKKWVDDARADKEIGGAKLDQNVGVAKKALDKFGTPELLDALNMTGAGNHPEFVRFCHRVGQAISEDALVSPQSATGAAKSAAERFYPTMSKE